MSPPAQPGAALWQEDPAEAWRPGQRLGLAAGLAAFDARPQALVHPERLAEGGLPLAGLAAQPAFAGPLGRLVAARFGLAGQPPAADFLARLALPGPARLAALMLLAPLPQLRRLASGLAALVLSPRILGIITRNERQMLQARLGAEAYQLATQEAPLLFPALAALDGLPREAGPLDLVAGPDWLAAFGSGVMLRFCAGQDAGLARRFALRLAPAEEALAAAVLPMAPATAQQMMRHLRRREPAWSAHIA